ncbi:helix-turn-helix domain-containing protein [Streptomyces sp. NPDC050504]|uniref:helix-turn-helix domain-containing protein n=1 Tax=Streptomyces sp. NPDC050504 TaxID=3365618 RepID=UPI0037A715FA
MSSVGKDPKALGTFLKTRRAQLEPAGVGLPDPGTPRRVPGLRREEVAQLAAISTDYYTRIEQGRIQASVPVLDALARALHLTDDQRGYLFELAGRPQAEAAGAVRERDITPYTRRLLDQLSGVPAVVLSDVLDVLAWNPLAAALITDFGELPEEDRNYVWLVFNDPAMRALYGDWEGGARSCLAYLRMNTSRCPDDPRLQRLVDRLSADPDFRRWWGAHEVAVQGSGNKEFHHPLVGTLVLDWDTLASPVTPGQQVVVWSAVPGSPSEKGLRRLAELTAAREESGRPPRTPTTAT